MQLTMSLLLLLWMVIVEANRTLRTNSGVLQNVRSEHHYLVSAASDGRAEESLVASPAEEASLTSSDIDAEKTSAAIEAMKQELSVPAIEHALAVYLESDADAKKTSAIGEKDGERPMTKHPIPATETPVTSRPLGVGGDAKQTSETLDTDQERATTEAPIPVTEAQQSHLGLPVSATIDQQVWTLNISISITEVLKLGDQKTTPLKSTSFESSKLAVSSSETPRKYALGSADDRNWTAVNDSESPQDQSDPKVHKHETSQLTSTTAEENEGLSHNRGSRSMSLLMVPVATFLAGRAASAALGTLGSLLGGAFGPTLPADDDAAAEAADELPGRD